MSKNYHVVPHGDQWAVKEEGNPNPISIHGTQRDGIDLGRGLAQLQRGELFIHRPNGQIRDRETYGPDPFPPRDPE